MYAIRIGPDHDHHWYSGEEIHGHSAWTRDPHRAYRFLTRDCADREAHTLARWLNSTTAAIVWIDP